MATTERAVRGEKDPNARPRAENTIQWCNYHGVERALVPLSYRRRDVLDEFAALSKAISQLPTTAATFTMADLDALSDRDPFPRPRGAGLVERHLNLLGAWEYGTRSASRRWLNPRYIHGHPFEDSRYTERQRVMLLRRAARLGVLGYRHVAPAWGVSEGAIKRWIDRRPIHYGAWRDRGRRRIGRTMQLIGAWTDRSVREVARLFRTYDGGRVRQWQYEHVDDDWTPPERPGKKWTVYRGGDVRDGV